MAEENPTEPLKTLSTEDRLKTIENDIEGLKRALEILERHTHSPSGDVAVLLRDL